MITRDFSKINALLKEYLPIVGFYPEEWVKESRNIALTNYNDDIALFEWFKDGCVYGHYFFRSRGRAAVIAAQEFISELFTTTDIKVIVGMTPITNKKAKWMNRMLGFKYTGIVKTEAGPCELVIMTKQDWENNNG